MRRYINVMKHLSLLFTAITFHFRTVKSQSRKLTRFLISPHSHKIIEENTFASKTNETPKTSTTKNNFEQNVDYDHYTNSY